MAREIKFRAWHSVKNTMLFVGDEFGTTNPLDCANYARQGQPVTLTQYTGLKDKNGVEIYEGDIVEYYSSKYIVVFSHERRGYFPFATDDGCGCCSTNVVTPSMCVVIGNIYENADLLANTVSE